MQNDLKPGQWSSLRSDTKPEILSNDSFELKGAVWMSHQKGLRSRIGFELYFSGGKRLGTFIQNVRYTVSKAILSLLQPKGED